MIAGRGWDCLLPGGWRLSGVAKRVGGAAAVVAPFTLTE